MSRAPESAPSPGGAKGLLRRGAEAGLHDIAKGVVVWLGAALGAVLVALVPPVRAFLANTSLDAWWILPTVALGAFAGAVLERWLLARPRIADLSERLRASEAEKATLLEAHQAETARLIEAHRAETAKLIEAHQATRLRFRRELEERIAEETKRVLATDQRVLEAQRWEARLSVAVLAIDKLDLMAHQMGARVVDALLAELEDCVIGERRGKTDVLYRLEQRYWLVMPYQSQASAIHLPKRARVSFQVNAPSKPGLPRALPCTVSVGVAELRPRGDVDEAAAHVVDQAEGALCAALQSGGGIYTPDDVPGSLPPSR